MWTTNESDLVLKERLGKIVFACRRKEGRARVHVMSAAAHAESMGHQCLFVNLDPTVLYLNSTSKLGTQQYRRNLVLTTIMKS